MLNSILATTTTAATTTATATTVTHFYSQVVVQQLSDFPLGDIQDRKPANIPYPHNAINSCDKNWKKARSSVVVSLTSSHTPSLDWFSSPASILSRPLKPAGHHAVFGGRRLARPKEKPASGLDGRSAIDDRITSKTIILDANELFIVAVRRASQFTGQEAR